eukprot:403339992
MNKERIKELALKITNIREDDEIKVESLQEVIKILEDRMIGQDIILKLLELKGTQKLINSLSHGNPRRRKLAAKLMCELVFQNEANQDKLCELCDFNPISGTVVINTSIPAKFRNRMVSILDLLRDPRKVQQLSDKQGKFWSYPRYEFSKQDTMSDIFDENDQSLKSLNEAGYLQQMTIQFPDPAEYIVGFFVSNQQGTGLAMSNPGSIGVQSLNQSLNSHSQRTASIGPGARQSSSTRRDYLHQSQHNSHNRQKSKEKNTANSILVVNNHHNSSVTNQGNSRLQNSIQKLGQKMRDQSKQSHHQTQNNSITSTSIHFSSQKQSVQHTTNPTLTNSAVKGSFNQTQKLNGISFAQVREANSLNTSPLKGSYTNNSAMQVNRLVSNFQGSAETINGNNQINSQRVSQYQVSDSIDGGGSVVSLESLDPNQIQKLLQSDLSTADRQQLNAYLQEYFSKSQSNYDNLKNVNLQLQHHPQSSSSVTGSNGQISHQPQSFLKSAGSGSESSTQIKNQLNSLAQKQGMKSVTPSSNNQKASSANNAFINNVNDMMNLQQNLKAQQNRTGQQTKDQIRIEQNYVPKRNGLAPTILESEETGFSAVEEEVKSNQLANRPTVYAGMQGKLDRQGSQDGSEAYNDLIQKYVDNSIDSSVQKQQSILIDQFYHSSSNQSSKRNSAVAGAAGQIIRQAVIKVSDKHLQQKIQNIKVYKDNGISQQKPSSISQTKNNLQIQSEYRDQLFIKKEDLNSMYPMTTKDKIRVVAQNLGSNRSSQRNNSNSSHGSSSAGGGSGRHQRNKYSYDYNQINVASQNYNRNVPSQQTFVQSQMTPDNMSRQIKQSYGLNSVNSYSNQKSNTKQSSNTINNSSSKQTSGRSQQSSNHHQQQQSINTYKTGTLDLSQTLNNNLASHQATNSIAFKSQNSRAQQNLQFSSKKNSHQAQSQQTSINNTMVNSSNKGNSNNNIDQKSASNSSSLGYYYQQNPNNQNNMNNSSALNSTQNTSLLMMLGHQQQLQNNRKTNNNSVISNGAHNNSISNNSYLMQNNNHHVRNNHAHKLSGNGGGLFNATTVVNVKDIDKKLLNLMKTMGN